MEHKHPKGNNKTRFTPVPDRFFPMSRWVIRRSYQIRTGKKIPPPRQPEYSVSQKPGLTLIGKNKFMPGHR